MQDLVLWGVSVLVLLSALKALFAYCGLTGKALDVVTSLLLAGMVGLVLKIDELEALLPWLESWGPIGMAMLVAFLINMGFYPKIVKMAVSRLRVLLLS